MKITVYTIVNCPFSKQEKEYLASHNLPFEEKNLETNREFLTEMLAVSNNFAGTPVTKIEKDDGQISVLKGFTKDEFDQVLGIVKEEPSQPPVNPAPVAPPPQPPTNPPAPSPVPTPPSTTPDRLNSLLNDLQSKSTSPTTPPTIPNPTFKAN